MHEKTAKMWMWNVYNTKYSRMNVAFYLKWRCWMMHWFFIQSWYWILFNFIATSFLVRKLKKKSESSNFEYQVLRSQFLQWGTYFKDNWFPIFTYISNSPKNQFKIFTAHKSRSEFWIWLVLRLKINFVHCTRREIATDFAENFLERKSLTGSLCVCSIWR